MTDLERRALLGDKQAREECTRRGIVLACPFCGGEKAKVRHACGDYFVECLKCHCTSSVTSTKETVVNDWNTRPAPPIGRCFECKHLGERTVHETGEKENFCNHDKYGLFALDSTNAYCSYFEPKERSEQ